MKDILKINDLEQLKLLSDPLKLGLVQAFAEEERTVAEAAEMLGEPLTKLYRHVDALLDAGLVEVTGERKKRGTVERRFRAVARRYEVEDGLLGATDPGPEDESIRALLRGAENEIMAALHGPKEPLAPSVARFRAKASPDRLRELQERMFSWLEEIGEEDEVPGDDAIEVGALIALYPLPRR